MNRSRRCFLWFSFFLTAFFLFFPVAFFSSWYWLQNVQIPRLLVGTLAASAVFSVLLATVKYRDLKWISLQLDFSAFDGLGPRVLERELLRLGYRVHTENERFVAGFRADYYLAPDIRIRWEKDSCTLEGPAFYLKKLARRHRRAQARIERGRKIRQMTDGRITGDRGTP